MRRLTELREMVDRGLELRREIAVREEELDAIEGWIVAWAAAGEQVPLIDEERAGKQFLAAGSKLSVPVVFTADKLVGSFKPGGDAHVKILDAAGPHLRMFYQVKNTFEMVPKHGKAFRKLAGELLGKDAPALVTAALARDKDGIPKSDIKVEWKRASEIGIATAHLPA